MLVLSKVSSYCFKEFVEVGSCSPGQDRIDGWTRGELPGAPTFKGS